MKTILQASADLNKAFSDLFLEIVKAFKIDILVNWLAEKLKTL